MTTHVETLPAGKPLPNFDKLLEEFSALDESSRNARATKRTDDATETMSYRNKLMPARDYSEGYNPAGWGPRLRGQDNYSPATTSFRCSIEEWRGKIDDHMRTFKEIISKLEWIDSHTKTRAIFRKHYLDFSSVVFEVTTWNARLTEVLEGDAVLLAHMDFNVMTSQCDRYQGELNKIISEIKENFFFAFLPFVYGPAKWYDKTVKNWKSSLRRVTKRYKDFQAAIACKVPFILKVLKTPTEDIVYYRLHTVDEKRKNYFSTSDIHVDEVCENFRQLCK